MTIKVSYNKTQYCFEAPGTGRKVHQFANEFLRTVPFINPDDIEATKRTLQDLFNKAEGKAARGWEAHAVSNELQSSIARVTKNYSDLGRGGIATPAA